MKKPECHDRMKQMVPTYDEDLIPAEMAGRQREIAHEAERTLGLRGA